MAKCSLCGNILKLGRGKMFVKKSGDIYNFCNSKCQNNWNMGREGKNLKWTGKFEKGHTPKKEMQEKA